MGASNFGSLNQASNYFVFIPKANDDEDFDIDLEFDYFNEDLVNSLSFFDNSVVFNTKRTDNYATINNVFSFNYGDVSIDVSLDIIKEYGYHEGVRLDYDFHIQFYCTQREYFSQNTDEQLIEIIEDFAECDYNAGFKRIIAKKFIKTFDKFKQEYSEKIEEVLRMVTNNELYRLGGFSDGTSIYQSVN